MINLIDFIFLTCGMELIVSVPQNYHDQVNKKAPNKRKKLINLIISKFKSLYTRHLWRNEKISHRMGENSFI